MTDLTQALAGLPGAELVCAGLADLDRGDETAMALLVAVGAPRLRRLGLAIPPADRLPHSPEIRLYQLLGREHPHGTHSRYRALIRRLVSFERALERERGPGAAHRRSP